MGDKKKSISNIDYPLKSSKKLEAALKPGNKTGHVAVMSPKEYLEHATRLPDSKEDNLLIDAFKSRLKKGKKFKALKLLGHNKADGRHRATAAEELGIKEVPVIDYRESGLKNMKGVHSVSKNGSVVGKVKKELRKERKSGGSVYSNVPPQLPINNEDPEAAFRRLIEWSFAVAPLFGRSAKADGGEVRRHGYATDGYVSDIEAAIRAAEEVNKRQEASHEKGVSGAVEFAPIGIEEPLTGYKVPLGSLPKETAQVVEPALQAASEIAPYFTPAAPIAAARDVAVGLREGDPTNVALSALGLPGKAAKAAAIGASAFMPSEAEAGVIDRALKAIRAYHGSPHKFDKFDISKIGTGEGHQAYGHGLYFAGNESVARGYRDMLAPPSVVQATMPSGKSFPVTKDYLTDLAHSLGDWQLRGVPSTMAERLSKSSNVDDYLQKLNSIDMNGLQQHFPKVAEDVEKEKKYFEWLNDKGRKLSVHRENPGHMYEVDIHANPEHLLDWDKPLRDQSSYVQKALSPQNLGLTEGGPSGQWNGRIGWADKTGLPFGPVTTGSTRPSQVFQDYDAPAIVYRQIGRENPETSSAMLNAAGIPGIKYLDQGSRNISDGSHNYVMFDPNLIDIMRRYAQGGDVEAQPEVAEQPSAVDRALKFVSQFNPVGTAEAGVKDALDVVSNLPKKRGKRDAAKIWLEK